MTLVFLTATLVSLLGMLLVLPFLRRQGVVDVPNLRSSHLTPTPRGGGAAVAVAIALATGVGIHRDLASDSWALGGLLGGVLVFATLGMADDLRGLDVSVRLVGQLVVAAPLAILLVRSDSIRPLGSASAVAATVTGIAWLVGYTNAFNFMDGVNGMAALNALLAGGWFLFLGLDLDLDAIAVLGAAVSGGALGFLPWNAPTARVFLGDVGSYALGSAIAGLALWAWLSEVSVLLVAAPLLVYLADTGSTLGRRVLSGRSWREAHREHTYQRLADLGLGHLGAAVVCTGASGLICAWAVGADRADIAGVWTVLGMGALVGAYLLLPRLLSARWITPNPVGRVVGPGHRGRA